MGGEGKGYGGFRGARGWSQRPRYSREAEGSWVEGREAEGACVEGREAEGAGIYELHM